MRNKKTNWAYWNLDTVRFRLSIFFPTPSWLFVITALRSFVLPRLPINTIFRIRKTRTTIFILNHKKVSNIPWVTAIMPTPDRISTIPPIAIKPGNLEMVCMINIPFSLSITYCRQNCLKITKSISVVPAIMISPIRCRNKNRCNVV